MNHFERSELTKRNEKFVLNKNAVPSIFENTNPHFKNIDVAHDADPVEFVDLGHSSQSLFVDAQVTVELNRDVQRQDSKRKICHLQEQNSELKKQLKVAESTIKKLNATIDAMKKNRYIIENVAENNRVELEEFIDCLCNGIQQGKDSYPEHVRSFCLGLFYYSPRAYSYIRKKFLNHLPHESTLRSWYRNSNVDVAPGIIKTAMDLLKEKAKKMIQNKKQMVVSLIFDEISIRKHVQWCLSSRKFLGYVTYGKGSQATDGDGDDDDIEDNIPVANQAIVFMVSCLNEFFQLPIAYYFIKSLDATERTDLLIKMMIELSKCDIIVGNVTFDGFPPNAVMCENLGASLKDDIDPTIKNPFDGSDAQVMLDPSHAEKLVRSALESRKVFFDENNQKIEWAHFIELVKYSENADNSFGLVHKLTKRHIDFRDRKMNVRTAVELLSESVANSMEYLMKLGVPEFSDAEGTIRFIRIFDRLFDVMNTSRIKTGNVYKCALHADNKTEVFEFLEEAKNYILSLKVAVKSRKKGNNLVPLVNSKLKTGFRGYVMDIISTMKIYNEFVEKQNCMESLATYRLSQDHLEIFFGKIRSMGGCNDNPTVQQFTSAFKKLLVHNDIIISKWSNISVGCSTNILSVSSKRVKLYDDLAGDVLVPAIENVDFDLQRETHSDSFAVEKLDQIERVAYLSQEMYNAGITFVANLIETRMLSADMCDDCRFALEQNEKIDTNMCITTSSRKPSKSTYQICKLADIGIKTFLNNGARSTFKQKIYVYVLSNINIEALYPFFVGDHDIEHKNFIIKYVVDEYTSIKCAYIAKQKTLEMQQRFLRNRFRKVLHHRGQ